jgi:hypothetical protein
MSDIRPDIPVVAAVPASEAGNSAFIPTTNPTSVPDPVQSASPASVSDSFKPNTDPEAVAPAAPSAPAVPELDYDKLAAAMLDAQDKRAAVLSRAEEIVRTGDYGPYPHHFVDGVFVPEKSGYNATPEEQALAGLEPTQTV